MGRISASEENLLGHLPVSRPLATGKYDTREELEEQIRGWVKLNNSFVLTARIVCVSQTTVANIYNSSLIGDPHESSHSESYYQMALQPDWLLSSMFAKTVVIASQMWPIGYAKLCHKAG